MTPQNACTEQLLCAANPNTVTCSTEDFVTSCNLHEPQESNNPSRYNRKQTTHWNKRQKVCLKEDQVNVLHPFAQHVCFSDIKSKTMQVRLFISRRSWNGSMPSKHRRNRCSGWQTLRSFCCLWNISIIQMRELASFVTSKLRSESLRGKCTKLNTVAASNNRDHRTRPLLFLVRNTYTFRVCSSCTSRSRIQRHAD